MSYDVMVFHPLKAPCELEQMRRWFQGQMENSTPAKDWQVFGAFLENMEKIFPPINQCPEDRLEYACEYEIHEEFVYMCFGNAVAQKAHDIAKRQAKIEHLGFWDVSQSFDRTFPITLPENRWPMMIEAGWIKYGRQFACDYKAIQKVLKQMKTAERSSVYVTDRFGNYIQAGGYQDVFVVETRQYTDAITYQHMRADRQQEDSEADAIVKVNGWEMKVPSSQILSENQVCMLFREFVGEITSEIKSGEMKSDRISSDEAKSNEINSDEMKADETNLDETKADGRIPDEAKLDNMKIFWKEIDI